MAEDLMNRADQAPDVIDAPEPVESHSPQLLGRITDVLRKNSVTRNAVVLGTSVVALASAYAFALRPATAAAECVTTTTTVTNPDGSTTTSTTTECNDNGGSETPPPTPAPADTPQPSQPEQDPPRHPSHNPNHSGNGNHRHPHHPRNDEVDPPDKLYSYDMCGGWGSRICTNGCGDVAAADFVSDLTGRRVTPLEVLPILSPEWYIPGSGTKAEGFHVVAKRFGLHEKPGSLASARRAIDEMGGVAVALFENSAALARSGQSSPITGAGHYVVLDRERNGKFAFADPNQAPGRYTEHTPSGRTRFWSSHELRQAGLTGVWTVTP